jgi:hypothetical protein
LFEERDWGATSFNAAPSDGRDRELYRAIRTWRDLTSLDRLREKSAMGTKNTVVVVSTRKMFTPTPTCPWPRGFPADSGDELTRKVVAAN